MGESYVTANPDTAQSFKGSVEVPIVVDQAEVGKRVTVRCDNHTVGNDPRTSRTTARKSQYRRHNGRDRGRAEAGEPCWRGATSTFSIDD